MKLFQIFLIACLVACGSVPGENGQDGTQGVQGPQGLQGPAGNPGAAGATGSQGPSGERGADGVQGEQGPQGPAGAAGPQGPQGLQGEPGEAAQVAHWVDQDGETVNVIGFADPHLYDDGNLYPIDAWDGTFTGGRSMVWYYQNRGCSGAPVGGLVSVNLTAGNAVLFDSQTNTYYKNPGEAAPVDVEYCSIRQDSGRSEWACVDMTNCRTRTAIPNESWEEVAPLNAVTAGISFPLEYHP